MKVRVEELPEAGRIFRFHETEKWFSSRINSEKDAREIDFESPIKVELEFVPETDRIKVSGHLKTTVRLGCSRCLQDYILELDESIDLTLLCPLPADAPEEIDLRPKDLDTEFYDGVNIDVDLIVAEQIFLALPQQPLCQSHCQGLCSGCGADLNVESCGCEERDAGSPFAALRSMEIDQ